MDLSTVGRLLRKGSYRSMTEFESHVRLVFNNCYTYNQANSDVVLMGQTLEKLFEKVWNSGKAQQPAAPVTIIVKTPIEKPEKPEKPEKRKKTKKEKKEKTSSPNTPPELGGSPIYTETTTLQSIPETLSDPNVQASKKQTGANYSPIDNAVLALEALSHEKEAVATAQRELDLNIPPSPEDPWLM